MSQIYSPLQLVIDNQRISERNLATKTKLARNSIRNVLNIGHNVTIATIEVLAKIFGYQVQILVCNEDDDFAPEYCVTAVCLQTQLTGFDSWKVHYFNFIDEFRRTLDPRLIILPPPHNLDLKLKALIAAIVVELCRESYMQVPSWAGKRYFLKEPWFLSGLENLKASAILESPLSFRNNNIFVLNNFLNRV